MQDNFATPALGHGLESDEALGLDPGCWDDDAKVALPFVAFSVIVGLLVATSSSSFPAFCFRNCDKQPT